mgnify:CR=1 FL=1
MDYYNYSKTQMFLYNFPIFLCWFLRDINYNFLYWAFLIHLNIVLKQNYVRNIGNKYFTIAYLTCVGRFFDATKEEELSNILNIVISHVIDNTTAQVNLLDENNEPTETNVNLTFYNDFTGVSKYNYLHTMNAYGYPDTMMIDPVLSYKVVAHTIPPVSIDNITLTPGKHTIIPLSTPQGELEIKMNSKIKYQYIVRQAGVDSTLNVQEINEIKNIDTQAVAISLGGIARELSIPENKKTLEDLPEKSSNMVTDLILESLNRK